MRYREPVLPLLLLAVTLVVFASIVFYAHNSVTSQTHDKRVNANSAPTRGPQAGSPLGVVANENDAGRMPALPQKVEVVKVDVDLVKVDALVLQRNTARVVGGLKNEDFLIYEDGTKQEITHFSQDKLPLSVVLAIDCGGCLNPYLRTLI